jgi:hypothetical protein
LKIYLESLSNEPNTKINNESVLSRRNYDEKSALANFLPRELLKFLNIDESQIEDIMDFQEQRLNSQDT